MPPKHTSALTQREDRYTKKLTGSALEGDEAAELTAAKYGCNEWWLLLERAGQ